LTYSAFSIILNHGIRKKTQGGRRRDESRKGHRPAGLGNGTFGASGQCLAGAAIERYGNASIRQVTLSTGQYREKRQPVFSTMPPQKQRTGRNQDSKDFYPSCTTPENGEDLEWHARARPFLKTTSTRRKSSPSQGNPGSLREDSPKKPRKGRATSSFTGCQRSGRRGDAARRPALLGQDPLPPCGHWQTVRASINTLYLWYT
jgi:hypothetical protein